MKLDLIGRKISLKQWKQLPPSARDHLTELSAETDAEIDAFASALERALSDSRLEAETLSDAKRADVAAWRNAAPVGEDAQRLLDDAGMSGLWPSLDRFGRYLVCSFARKQDHERLRRALAELGYVEP